MDYIATPQDYWLSPNALHIETNALGNPDYIQASCVSGAQILVFIKDIPGLDYDAGHNYRRWPLVASPTVFTTHTEKYVYAAIPRPVSSSEASPTSNTALIVFPSEKIDIYGRNAAGAILGSDRYYYIYLGGILTSSGDNGTTPREWQSTFATGYLSSDAAIAAGPTESPWYQYSSVDQTTTFLKNLTMKVGTWFVNLFARALTIVSGGSISFENGGTLTGIADGDTSPTSADRIATPAYVDRAALSKLHPDKTDFGLEMGSLAVNGKADVFGNLVAHDDLTIGTYNKGISGGHVDFYGNAELESLALRSSLSVPEINYNRTTISVGNKWQTVGAGIIETVTPYDTYTGRIKLKLEDGELGAVALDDICQGVFHFLDKPNDTETTDTHDGNFHFAGFTTVYFKVTKIFAEDNSEFEYEIRAASDTTWQDATHPQPFMHFAAYANPTNADRQASRLTTTSYQLHLAGMTSWTYTQDNIRLIIGWLDGFTLRQRVWNKEKKEYENVDKPLHGEGIAVGNIYMWGNIDQFDRAPSVISQQLYYKATSGVPTPSLSPLPAVNGASSSPFGAAASQAAPTPPEGILISTDHQHVNLNGWQTTPITPTPELRYVWQQWLYTYSDGTYDVSEVSFHSADTTTLTVQLNRSLISVAISDWYDVEKPDTITFDVTARITDAEQPLLITEALASLTADGVPTLSSSLFGTAASQAASLLAPSLTADGASPSSVADFGSSLPLREGQGGSLAYTTTLAADSKSVIFHITLNGYVGTSIDGATPEDTYIYITLRTATGSATAPLTIAQNREGEDGIDGQDGKPGAKGDKGDAGTGIDIKGSALKYYAFHIDYFADQKQSGLYLLGSKQSGTHAVLGTYVYTYTAETDTTEISEATLGDAYYVEGNGHLYVSTGGEQGSVATIVHWTDCGEIRGQDAVLYTLDIPNTVLEHLTTFPITVVKTSGEDTAPITYDQAVAEGVAILGEAVEWNAQHQRFHLPDGTVKGTTYTITLTRNGYVIHTYTVQCIGNGDRGYVGVSVRRSEWQPNVYYRNDSEEGSADRDGNRYLDEVSITDPATGQAQWFLAQAAHNGNISTLDNKPISATTTPYWQPINDLRPLRTPFADISQALIDYLQVSQIILKRNGGTGEIYGAIGGSTEFPLWFGGKTIQEANAKIGIDGSVYFNNGYFEGSIQARNFSQYLTECVAEEYYADPRYQNFDYDNVRDRFVHSVSEFGGSYYSACAIDLESSSPRQGSVRHWIVLPCPTAANVGKTYEIIAPNYISQGRIYDGGYADIQNWPIGVTSLNGKLLPDGETQEWIDPTIGAGNTIDHQHGALVTLWGNRAHFATSPAYTAAILCSNAYATTNPTDDNTSRLRVVCVARQLSTGSGSTTTYYQWAILDSHNVRFTSADQLTLIDT